MEGYWSLLFADYLQKASIDKLLVTVGSGGGGGGGDAAAVEEKKEEEVDIGAGMDMFGDGGGGDY